jgi:hypothetical protein
MAEDFDDDPHDQDVFAPVSVQSLKHIHLDTAQGVARITLNRPPANVLSVEMMQELATAIESLEYQREVKLVTLFGETIGTSARRWMSRLPGMLHRTIAYAKAKPSIVPPVAVSTPITRVFQNTWRLTGP